MIVPMKHLTVLTRTADRADAVERLRDVGVLHLVDAAPDTPAIREALTRLHEAEQAAALVAAQAAKVKRSARAAGSVSAGVPGYTPPADPAAILAIAREQEAAEAEMQALNRDCARYSPFGDFDPAAAISLAASNIPVVLFKAPPGTTNSADGAAFRTILGHSPDACYGVQIGATALPDGFEPVEPPARRLAEIVAARDAAAVRVTQAGERLAAFAPALAALHRHRDAQADAFDFATACEGMSADGGVVWLTGFAPVDSVPAVLGAARSHGWGVLARDPEADDRVPTLLRPPRVFRPILRLFGFLGISPAYTEADISGTFFIFFTIFFAMLVGDAGYGVLLLAGSLWARHRATGAAREVFTLFTVFSAATVAWGILTCCYFGIAPDALPALLNHGAARWLGVQNNIMLVCFGLGAVHLSLGHAWNAIGLFPDSRFLSQVGWFGVIWTMFCVSCSIIGIFAFPSFMYPVAVISILLIACFMLKRSELKTNGVDLGMLPLNIVSTLGDVISYVRLFAVATASVKLAETFNGMAIGLTLPWFIKIPAVLAILLLGHGLNLAMSALSILVHAVRLNTLEFSNHKGISWSGFAYKPLRRRQPAS
jgi:V/A-type H+-transporting ATPase subunit I